MPSRDLETIGAAHSIDSGENLNREDVETYDACSSLDCVKLVCPFLDTGHVGNTARR